MPLALKERIKRYYLELVNDKRKGAQDQLFSFLLLLASFIYGCILRIILFFYRHGLLSSSRTGCPVISVGNITWGGTGKTLLTEAIARFCKQSHKQVAIFTRGYGQDEVDLLNSKFRDLPILVGRDRVKMAQQAKRQYNLDLIILDDGFQHWRLERDCDVVLIDAGSPFGNGRLIPRGILREPLSSLKRADIIVLTKASLAESRAPGTLASLKQKLRRYNQHAPIYGADHQVTSLRDLRTAEKLHPQAIKNQRIGLVCALGQPQSFTDTLSSLGAEVSLELFFPDHHQYSKQDLADIEKQCQKNNLSVIVTTEKDEVKLKRLLGEKGSPLTVLVLDIEFKINQNEDEFFGRLIADRQSLRPYPILVLSDGKAGHLTQAKAVAGLIRKKKLHQGIPAEDIQTEIVEVKFRNRLNRILLELCCLFSNKSCRHCFLCLRFCLQRASFRQLIRSPAKVIICAGSSLSAVNLFLAYKNRAKTIILMKPAFLSLDRFDLVIVPEHDHLKPKDHVLITRIAPNPVDQEYLQEQAEALLNRIQKTEDRGQSQGTTIGVLIGGNTAKFSLTLSSVKALVAQLKQSAENLNGRMLVTTSRRTPKDVETFLKDDLSGFARCALLVIANENNIPEAVGGILGLSDIVVVSGESISMVSEAVNARKDLLVFLPQKRTKSFTKQEDFLQKLAQDRLLKLIRPQELYSQIKDYRENRLQQKGIHDHELIAQALDKLL